MSSVHPMLYLVSLVKTVNVHFMLIMNSRVGQFCTFPRILTKLKCFRLASVGPKWLYFLKIILAQKRQEKLPFLNNKNSHRALRAHTAHRGTYGANMQWKKPYIFNLVLTLHISGLTKHPPTLNWTGLTGAKYFDVIGPVMQQYPPPPHYQG